MESSGQWVADVQIDGECDLCGWVGVVDAVIDPEDRVNGFDAQWVCPTCTAPHIEKEGTW